MHKYSVASINGGLGLTVGSGRWREVGRVGATGILVVVRWDMVGATGPVYGVDDISDVDVFDNDDDDFDDDLNEIVGIRMFVAFPKSDQSPSSKSSSVLAFLSSPAWMFDLTSFIVKHDGFVWTESASIRILVVT